MHFAGLLGMPRRIYTYAPDRGWELVELDQHHRRIRADFGHFHLGLERVAFGPQGKLAGDDPWDAWTLEWATASPPPEYNFEHVPVVRSSRPLWDLKNPEDPDWKFEQ